LATPLEFRPDAETAASLMARAERCRHLSRIASIPFSVRMLHALAQQLEGEARRTEAARSLTAQA
jgi:hypothetical protein